MAEGSSYTMRDLTHIVVFQKAAIILSGISHKYLCGKRHNYTIRDLTHIVVWQKATIIL